MNEHRDIGYLTILTTSAKGLEIKSKEGKYYAVKHYKDKYVINVGKALEKTTNNFCYAVPHRVSIIYDESRHSIAFFYDPGVNDNLYQYDDNGQVNILKLYGNLLFGDSFVHQDKEEKALKVGDVVLISGHRLAIVRYIGYTEFASGKWVGVELKGHRDQEYGCDGSCGGKRYFQTKHAKSGLFVRGIVRKIPPE